jgi:hypothetical protein
MGAPIEDTCTGSAFTGRCVDCVLTAAADGTWEGLGVASGGKRH